MISHPLITPHFLDTRQANTSGSILGIGAVPNLRDNGFSSQACVQTWMAFNESDTTLQLS